MLPGVGDANILRSLHRTIAYIGVLWQVPQVPDMIS